MFLAVLDHIVSRQFFALLDGDEGLWSFAPVAILNSDDAAFQDIGVRDDEGFHGKGGDVLAACTLVSVGLIVFLESCTYQK